MTIYLFQKDLGAEHEIRHYFILRGLIYEGANLRREPCVRGVGGLVFGGLYPGAYIEDFTVFDSQKVYYSYSYMPAALNSVTIIESLGAQLLHD